jgi:hypothetical protein
MCTTHHKQEQPASESRSHKETLGFKATRKSNSWLENDSPESHNAGMKIDVEKLAETIQSLPLIDRLRLVRLVPELKTFGCELIRMSPQVKVDSFEEDQRPYCELVRQLLIEGVLGRLESPEDHYYEIYGPNRTFFVTLFREPESVSILDSWPADAPPRTVVFSGEIDAD